MHVGATDPLARFLESSAHAAGSLPLVSIAIDVAVEGGLAIVTTERLFRNAESISIEATMTFPVPIDATLCGLSVAPIIINRPTRSSTLHLTKIRPSRRQLCEACAREDESKRAETKSAG